jgi:transcriptional regulator with XRE-family HTH domain
MSGTDLRAAREHLELTQVQAARRWRVSQAYLSLMERGKRPVPNRVARLAVRSDQRLATGLAPDSVLRKTTDFERQLGSLGYPGFQYLADVRNVENPAAVVLATLRAREVPARVTEALPWVLLTYQHLDWDWLLDQVRLVNGQNRLGFLVTLAKQLAERQGNQTARTELEHVEQRLQEARLVKEDSMGRSLTSVERDHLRTARSAFAAHWNVLTSLDVEQLRYAG